MPLQEMVNAVQQGAAAQKTTRESDSQPPNHGIDPSDLIPTSMVPEEYPHLFNDKQWQWLMRQRDRNGLSHAIVVMGMRRMFLSRDRFAIWLSTRAEQGIRS